MITPPIRPHIRTPITHGISKPSGGASVLWDPSDGAFTLGGWWDPAIEDWKTKAAQEYMTINESTDPDQITLLEDRSGVGIDLPSALGESFEPKVGEINALRATDFVPTDVYRTASIDALTLFGAESSSVCTVAHLDVDIATTFVTIANMNLLLGFADATLYLRLPGSISIGFPVGFLGNDKIYFGGRNDADTQIQRVDGTEIQSAPGAGSIVGTDVMDVGLAWNGQMGDLIVTTTEVSTSDFEKLEGFLAWKWGLEGNLPVGHTYKAAAPNV